MFKNYFLIGIRNIVRHKGYASINIAGLAIGMTACMLILLFIQYELSYENMHADTDRIYRVLTIDKAMGTNSQRVGITMPALAPALVEHFSEIESGLRLTFGNRTLLTYGDNPGIYAEKFRSADANFFDFFKFKLSAGDPASALSEPFSIVLTKTLARQLFGQEEAFGKTLRTANGNDLKVTGVLEDLPANTHLDFDALGSISTVVSLFKARQPEGSTQPVWVDSWRMIAMPAYVKFIPGSDLSGMDAKINEFIREKEVSENFDITLQNLNDVHLKSKDIIFETVDNRGDIDNLYAFGIIALLILIIASVNYMNLSTARSAQRAREVGLRKVVGSQKSQLMLQFLGESLLLTFLALAAAFPLASLVIPWLNNLTGMPLSIDIIGNPILLGFVLGMLIIVGILAGIYPAVALASFKPATVLKGSFKTSSRGAALRKILVVFQFAISIALISTALLVKKQMNFIQHKDIGYHREQVIVFDMFDRAMGENLPEFMEKLKEHSSFTSVAGAGNVPGRTFGRTRVRPEGASEEDIWIWSRLGITPEFLNTLDIEISEGRNFSREMSTDTAGVVLVNETAVEMLGWDDPLNKKLYFGQDDSTGTQVIGVVKDFHFAGLQQNIEPVVIFNLSDDQANLLAGRIAAGGIREAMEYSERAWREIFPQHPFQYSFLDDEFDNLYRRDINSGKIIDIFAGLAILIALLGLLGLASHAITQRTKEIGVRKVLGASSSQIVRLFVLDFSRWVVLANLFAWPAAYFAMAKWLENYAYKTDIGIIVFAIATGSSLLVAALTITIQSLNAASADPVKSLRYE